MMSRVAQLDSHILDEELFDNFHSQLSTKFSKFYKSFYTSYSEEIKLILKSLLFKFTFFTNDQTYGNQLSGIKLIDKSNRGPLRKKIKVLYYLLFIIGDYTIKKLSNKIDSIDDSNLTKEESIMLKLKPIIGFFEKIYNLLNLINFLTFLVFRKFDNLKFFLLNISTKSTIKNLEQNVNYEFQNQQLLWNTLVESMNYLLPIYQQFDSTFNMDFLSHFLLFESNKNLQGSLTFEELPIATCAICQNKLIRNPYITNCNHIYDYLCLAEKTGFFQKNWNCLRCGKIVDSSQPFNDINKDSIIFNNNYNVEESSSNYLSDESNEVEEEEFEKSLEENDFNHTESDSFNNVDDLNDEYFGF